jgi:hypothetical protein
LMQRMFTPGEGGVVQRRRRLVLRGRGWWKRWRRRVLRGRPRRVGSGWWRRRWSWAVDRDPIPVLIELLRARPEVDSILTKNDPAPARRVHAHLVRHMLALKLNHEPEAGSIEPGDAERVDLPHGANALVDLCHLLLIPMLHGEVPHHDFRQPLRLPLEAVRRVFHPHELYQGPVEVERLGSHGHLPPLRRSKAEQSHALRRSQHLVTKGGRPQAKSSVDQWRRGDRSRGRRDLDEGVARSLLPISFTDPNFDVVRAVGSHLVAFHRLLRGRVARRKAAVSAVTTIRRWRGDRLRGGRAR